MQNASKGFPRYRVTTFGPGTDWLDSVRPSAISRDGVIVGHFSDHEIHRHIGFYFNGEFNPVRAGDAYFTLAGIDDEGFACGSYSTMNDLVVVDTNTGAHRVHAITQANSLETTFVSADGTLGGSALFLSPRENQIGFYGGWFAKRNGLDISLIEPIRLAPGFREELAAALSGREEIDRRHLHVCAKNASGTMLAVAVRVGGDLESYPFFIEPDGSMRFVFGERWRKCPTGHDSTVLGEDGTIAIQAMCGVPPHHTVLWVQPDTCCPACKRPLHAVFQEELEGDASLAPQICGCFEDSVFYAGPPGCIHMHGMSGKHWVGEAGHCYDGALSPTTPEGAGFGVLWRKEEDRFAYELFNNLIEDPSEYTVLGAEAINAKGQIACRVIDRHKRYYGARLDPVA